MNSNKIELLPNRGTILAQNQKVPSAREPCVSSLAVSHYLPHLSDQDMTAAQTLAQNDGWGQKQWVERDTISAWRVLWCEPRHPTITAALSFVVGVVLSLWGYTLQKPAAEGKIRLFCGTVNRATNVFDGILGERWVQMLNVHHEACSCQCHCMLPLR